jgi:hypothetical protein
MVKFIKQTTILKIAFISIDYFTKIKAPPHGLDPSCGDTLPNGCPENIDPVKEVSKMAEKGITLYSVGCEPALLPYKEFFSALAFKTGGQYIPLRNALLLAKVIVGGAVEEISLERLMEDVEREVEEKRKKGVLDEKVLSEHVQFQLNLRGVTTNQIQLNNSDMEKASDLAINYAKMESLASLREEHTKNKKTLFGGHMPRPGDSAFGAPTMHHASMAMSSMPYPSMAPMYSDSASALYDTSSLVQEESYSVANKGISAAQSERLVQKALSRNKKN